jgi:hypothetical protein
MEIIHWLIEKYQETENSGKIIIIIISIFILFVILKPYISDFFDILLSLLKGIKKIFYRLFKINKNITTNNKVSSKIDIYNHNIINEMNHIKIMIKSIDLGNIEKNNIFINIMNIQLNNVEKNIIKFIDNNNNINEINDNEFKRKIFDLLTDIIDDTNKDLIITLGKEIYEYIILDPIKGLRKWSKSNDESMWMLIDNFCDQKGINNSMKFNLVLTSLSTSLNVIYSGLEKRFNGFNGELNSLIKKNKDYRIWKF